MLTVEQMADIAALAMAKLYAQQARAAYIFRQIEKQTRDEEVKYVTQYYIKPLLAKLKPQKIKGLAAQIASDIEIMSEGANKWKFSKEPVQNLATWRFESQNN